MAEIVLTGLNGGNPLGFLAALGTFRTLSDALPGRVRMNWQQELGGWRPCLLVEDEDIRWADPREISGTLACLLGTPAQLPADEVFQKVGELEENYRKKRKALAEQEKKLKKEAKEAGIKRAELFNHVAERTKTDRQKVGELRQKWLVALRDIVLSPEMGLGKTLSVMPDEMREMAIKVAGVCSARDRLVADLLAAFGSEVCEKYDFIEYTPFCFVTGSGHQFFLETIQKLMSVVTVQHLHKTLFSTWAYDDTRFSLRWDPLDDRRYALMWDDPTAQGNEARTMWAANLLGYRALSLLPSYATDKGLRTTGFDSVGEVFTWPLWDAPISLDLLRPLLALKSLGDRPLDRKKLGAIGVSEVYESQRIRIGTPPLMKINFSQPTVV